MVLPRPPATGNEAKAGEPQLAAVVRMRLAEAKLNSDLPGLDTIAGKSNYFIGGDPHGWHRDVSLYARVEYAAVHPGIDLVRYGTQREMNYDFDIAPGADPEKIKLVFEGSRGSRSMQKGI